MDTQSEADLFTSAPQGQIYVCPACGRTSPTRSGDDAAGNRVAPGLWDTSCMTWSVLCFVEKRNGNWVKVHA